LLAASLLRMVTSVSLAKAPADTERGATAGFWTRVEGIAAEGAELAVRFRELEAADMAAFDAFIVALRMPRSTDEEAEARRQALVAATRRATDAPLSTLVACLEVLALADQLLTVASDVRLRAEADLGGAVELAHAAFRAAELNVRVNLPGLRDDPSHDEYAARHQELSEALEIQYPELRRRVLEWLA